MIASVNHDGDYVKWPDGHLEEVNACPICKSKNSKILESGLIDHMSSPPTGLWRMLTCVDCGITYLSPRPDRQSIIMAYSQYYTHTSEKDDLVNNALRSIKDNLSKRYYLSSSGGGGAIDRLVYVISRIIFPVSLYLDAKSRHIFKIKDKPGRLLDVGCGNGEFLRLADCFGWSVVGVDFDEHAITEAKTNGLDVRVGGVEALTEGAKFDFISLSHVVEHVYDPVVLIQSCYALLNDGGILWLETPNVNSIGYATYKSIWRGLEPPRHLVLFCRSSLTKLLFDAGFVTVEQKLHTLSGVYMSLASERLLNASSPCKSVVTCRVRKLAKLYRMMHLEAMQLFSKQRREFLTLVAKK